MAVVKWPGLQQYDAEMKQYIATHYEPKLRFDPVPVYAVTLAEDVPTGAALGTRYVIEFQDDGYSMIWVETKAPQQAANESVSFMCICSDGQNPNMSISQFFYGTAASKSAVLASTQGGKFGMEATAGSGTPGGSTPLLYKIWNPLAAGTTITGIALHNTTESRLPAGTTITIYAATEV